MAASGFARAGGLLCILLQMVPPVRVPMASNGPISGAIRMTLSDERRISWLWRCRPRVPKFNRTSACLLRVLLLAWSVAYRAPNSDLVFLFLSLFWGIGTLVVVLVLVHPGD